MENKFEKNRGFTLVEMMVALGLFSVVVLVATGGFVRSLRTERQSSAFMSVNSNLITVIEQFAREIRTGSGFSGVSDSLSFTNAAGEAVVYCLQNGAIMRNTGSSCASGQKITGGGISVQYLNFIVSGNQSSDGSPPRVTILIGARPENQSASLYNLNIQTTVSSRILDG